jgi:hypothetical protein
MTWSTTTGRIEAVERTFYSFKTSSDGQHLYVRCWMDVKGKPEALTIHVTVEVKSDTGEACSTFLQEAKRAGLMIRPESMVRPGSPMHRVGVDHSPAKVVDLFDKMLGRGGGMDAEVMLQEVISAYRTCPHVLLLARAFDEFQGSEYGGWRADVWVNHVMCLRLNRTGDFNFRNLPRIDLNRLLDDVMRGGEIRCVWGV